MQHEEQYYFWHSLQLALTCLWLFFIHSILARCQRVASCAHPIDADYIIPPEEGRDFLKSSVLRLWNFFVRECPEEAQQHSKWQESVVSKSHLHWGENEAHNEVG